MRFFNTAGVCLPDWHYMLPPEPRLPEARRLVDQGEYFVLHAPRQTGKTTTHAEILERQDAYHEAAPRLVMMGLLHRIVNGGGAVEREYGLGRGRIDLIVRWPYRGADRKRTEQREPVELKGWRGNEPDPLARGLTQLDRTPAGRPVTLLRA